MRRRRSELDSSVVKPLRPLLVLALSAAVAISLSAADDGVLPKGMPAARYDVMVMRSPFTAPTAAAPVATPAPVAAGPRWWDQMSLTSIMDRGGVYYIGLWDKASSRHYLLATGKTDEDSQLLLNGVQWNDRLDQVSATVSKGAETAPPIRFDATAAAASTTAPVSPMQQPPSVPRPLPNALPPTLPPGFSGTPPPPPPGMGNMGNPVVRRQAPISSRPNATPQPGANRPTNGPRRLVVPNGED